jgi:SAM-dependent methyltransferase
VDLAVHGVAERDGTVLEYGCGNGRITLPLARSGVTVYGVDLSAPMLADLRLRLKEEDEGAQARVRTKRGDMRAVKLRERFDLVIVPFNALLHLYSREDVERFLARVREHLAPGGTFVCDMSMPSLEDLARDPATPFRAPRFRHPTTGDLVRYAEHYDYDRARQVLFVSMTFEPVAAPERAWMTPLAHRQFFPREWEALLHYNGFDVVRVDGDFYGGPLDGQSDVMVWHAKARKKP